MLPTRVTKLQANWTSSRRGQPIRAIILHDTERPNDASNSIRYLQRGGERLDGSDRQVSIHLLIQEDGETYRMVSDDLGANHCGFGTWTCEGIVYSPSGINLNTCTLGIELEHTANSNVAYPEIQLLNCGYWINYWRSKYGRIPILLHRQVDPRRRSDPIHLDVGIFEHYAAKAREVTPTPSNPINYRAIVPQVIYTDRNLASTFAGNSDRPALVLANEVVPIGDITNGWAWIATGIGFVPVNTLVKVNE